MLPLTDRSPWRVSYCPSTSTTVATDRRQTGFHRRFRDRLFRDVLANSLKRQLVQSITVMLRILPCVGRGKETLSPQAPWRPRNVGEPLSPRYALAYPLPSWDLKSRTTPSTTYKTLEILEYSVVEPPPCPPRSRVRPHARTARNPFWQAVSWKSLLTTTSLEGHRGRSKSLTQPTHRLGPITWQTWLPRSAVEVDASFVPSRVVPSCTAAAFLLKGRLHAGKARAPQQRTASRHVWPPANSLSAVPAGTSPRQVEAKPLRSDFMRDGPSVQSRSGDSTKRLICILICFTSPTDKHALRSIPFE